MEQTNCDGRSLLNIVEQCLHCKPSKEAFVSEEFISEIEYPFTQLPTKIWEMNLQPTEFLVLTRIIYRAGLRGQCFESRANIAQACNISPRSVSSAFSTLEMLNIISIRSRKAEMKPNLIRINSLAQWQSKMQSPSEKELPSASIAQGLVQPLQEASATIAHGTRSLELDQLKLDQCIKTVPTASAVEVLEAENQVPLYKADKKNKEQTGGSLIFEAFADAYAERYGFEPARGKEANRWAKKIYEEVGTTEGQDLVRHYVHMNKQWFLQKGHSLEWCFRDLTEVKRSFTTGRTNTSAQIKQIEQRQTAKETSDEVQQSNGELAAAWARIDTTRTIKI
jgi:hypothetical protein